MKLSCFIVDDEPLAIEVLLSHLEKVDRLELAGTFQNAIAAFEAFQEQPVDLIFLDIQMPGLSGIHFLKSLKSPPHVIFTTAYREYAMDGFDLDVADYLLKPVSFERFLKAINKVYAMEKNAEYPPNDTEILEETSAPLYVQIGNKRVKVHPDDILYIESQRDYVKIKTEEKEISALQTITYIEQKLSAGHFLRIHRSFIINLDKIESWSPNEIGLPGIEIPIGRTYKSEVLKVLNNRTEIL